MTATATPSIDTVTFVPLGTWVVDAARSTVGFEVRHIKLAKVRGRFRAVEGTICHDGNGLSIHGTVDVGSIDTGEARRDVRLHEEGFFDVERHPTIAIEAVSGPGSAAEDLAVYGTITIRGVERPVEFDVDGPAIPVDGDGDLRLRARGSVSRRAFGLNWDRAFAVGGLVIDDRVALVLDVVLVQAPS